MLLITDLMDKAGYESALRYLVSQQMDVYVIQVLSVEEIDPDIKGDLKLLDCDRCRRGRNHRQRPAHRALQTDAGRIYRWGPQLLQSPRHELPDGPHRFAGRTISGRLLRKRGLVK